MGSNAEYEVLFFKFNKTSGVFTITQAKLKPYAYDD